ncbi:WecB/TagA/CpsF family glycosyltransferase [bacterium]|nr:WecB/TagA/CpsF family glycosyltransferase [bacterium]
MVKHLLPFSFGLFFFLTFYFLLHKGFKKYAFYSKIIFYLSFFISLIILQFFKIEFSYWVVISIWGLFNLIISNIKMSKLLRLLLYLLSFVIIWRFTGLKIVLQKYSLYSFASGFYTVMFLIIIVYLFSYLSEMSGLSNILFFTITLSIFIGLKFIFNGDTEELILNAFLLGISFAILLLEIILSHYKIDRTDGRLLGFSVGVLIIFSGSQNFIFEYTILPIFILFILFLINSWIILKRLKKKSKGNGKIIIYRENDLIGFLIIVLLLTVLTGIFLQSFSFSKIFILFTVLILFALEFYLFSLFLRKDEVSIKYGLNKVNILGIDIDNLDFDDSFNKIKTAIENNDKLFIVTINPIILMHGLENKKFFEIISNADIILPDGNGIYWASLILGEPLKERVPGVEILEKIFDYPPEKMNVLLFGAKKGIGKKIRNNFKKKYANLNIEVMDGYSNPKEREALRLKVRDNRYNLILVGLGSPKQEEWIYNEYSNSSVKQGVFIGVGGSFDVLSGVKKRVRTKWRKLGLEWLIRIFSEPKKRVGQLTQLWNFILKIFIFNLK